MNAYIPIASRPICSGLMFVLVLSGLSSFAWAEDGGVSQLNAGDTAWVLMSSALVLAMIIPGQLYLLAYDGRQLQFFNTFPTPDIHDYLYFILNGLDQWGQSPFHTPVHLAGHVVADSPLYGLLETYLGQVRMVDQHLLPSNWVHPHVSGTQFFDLLSFAACGSSADN